MPIFVFRIVSEMVNARIFSISVFVFSMFVAVFNVFGGFLVFVYYGKIGKFFDAIFAVLLFSNLNEYVLMGFLGIKLIATAIVPFETPSK